MLPIWKIFNKTFFSENILGDLTKSITQKDFFLCFDNDKFHQPHEKYEELEMIRLENPAYSKDLASSGLLSSGFFKKNLLISKIFNNKKNLSKRIKK